MGGYGSTKAGYNNGSAYDDLATSPGGLAGDIEIDFKGVILLLFIIVIIKGGIR